MRKQDAIKILTDGEWWYYLGDTCPDIYNLSDAIDYAIDAMHERDALKAEIEQLKHERDAAITDLRICCGCEACKFRFKPDCLHKMCINHNYSNWQWRGIKEGAEDG
ncbi:hypothetical protein H8699_02180 [Christensenellaceae bacterium NSJ-44]|uniref:Coil containing protein n=1 Tax=Luoshenia tenuis TaxID=2763654 RepID=A0A926CYD9_9FIRM|nr:hypothetical protein [Luoshenia tenuis]MBC8528247.1 hypothetical protein [Luoshenia tenuis]